MKRWLGVLLAAVIGCASSAEDCTAEGCPFGFRSSVTVFAPETMTGVASGTLTVCVGDECQEASFQWDGPDSVETISVAGEDGDAVSAELSMPDGLVLSADGRLADYRPNGDCGPTCTGAELQLAAP